MKNLNKPAARTMTSQPKTQAQMNANPYHNPLYTDPIKLGGVEIAPIDLLEHVLATGGTGSGKTRSFLLPLVESILKRFGGQPDTKAAMMLMDAKGDMAELASLCVRRSGRADDLCLLGQNGNCWFDLFALFDGDPTRVSNFLYETLEERGSGGPSRGGSNESFWEENARRLLRSATTLAKANSGLGLGGLAGISSAIIRIFEVRTHSEDDAADEAVETILNEVESARDAGLVPEDELQTLSEYIKNDVRHGNPNTWAIIANMARNYTSHFSSPELQSLFTEQPGRRRILPETVIDEGLLLIVNLSPVIYGESATPFRMAIKKAFYERILQREHLCVIKDGQPRRINGIRPILCVMDEFHTTLNARGRAADAYFLDRAREFRCMCILASQGISAINSVLGDKNLLDHLLNNCRTKFFFANDCPQTSDYFETLGGNEERFVQSFSHEPVRPAPRFRLPNHRFVDPARTRITSVSLNIQKHPRFSAAELGGLPNGTALVVKKGRELVHFSRDPQHYALKPGGK
jgi:hypothetical protein